MTTGAAWMGVLAGGAPVEVAVVVLPAVGHKPPLVGVEGLLLLVPLERELQLLLLELVPLRLVEPVHDVGREGTRAPPLSFTRLPTQN